MWLFNISCWEPLNLPEWLLVGQLFVRVVGCYTTMVSSLSCFPTVQRWCISLEVGHFQRKIYLATWQIFTQIGSSTITFRCNVDAAALTKSNRLPALPESRLTQGTVCAVSPCESPPQRVGRRAEEGVLLPQSTYKFPLLLQIFLSASQIQSRLQTNASSFKLRRSWWIIIPERPHFRFKVYFVIVS